MQIKISPKELDKIVANHVREKFGCRNKLLLSYTLDDESLVNAIGVVVEVPNKILK